MQDLLEDLKEALNDEFGASTETTETVPQQLISAKDVVLTVGYSSLVLTVLSQVPKSSPFELLITEQQ